MGDLPQVQVDMSELSDLCHLGKILGNPLDLKTIITKTIIDWKVVRGDVEYLELGNCWLLFRFANSGDRQFVWNERPWHIQGELLVLLPWRPRFDTYNEELTSVDLWIRIPKFSPELFNFESARAVLRLNHLGDFVKMEHFMAVRGNLKFARFCVNMDITKTLTSSAMIPRHGGCD